MISHPCCFLPSKVAGYSGSPTTSPDAFCQMIRASTLLPGSSTFEGRKKVSNAKYFPGSTLTELYQWPSAYCLPPPDKTAVGILLNVVFLSMYATGVISFRADSIFQSERFIC